jgi:hypothetical protein
MSENGGEEKDAAWRRVALPVAKPERRRRAPLRLGNASRRTIRAIAECVAPSRPLGFDPGEVAVDFTERYLPYLPPFFARAFPLALRLVEWAPLFFAGRLARASRLPPEARARYFLALGASRLQTVREIWKAARGIVACAIYSRPEVHALIGYAPQVFVDEKVRFRRERFGAPEPW